MKYIKKPIVVDAYIWTGKADPVVEMYSRDPVFDDKYIICQNCGRPMNTHGKIKTLEDSDLSYHLVCVDDYIIKGVEGEHYACKPRIFNKTYQAYMPELIN